MLANASNADWPIGRPSREMRAGSRVAVEMFRGARQLYLESGGGGHSREGAAAIEEHLARWLQKAALPENVPGTARILRILLWRMTVGEAKPEEWNGPRDLVGGLRWMRGDYEGPDAT
jgi:hypothetical protein